jgi:DNA-binding GntR family transcriptional regulator
MRGFRPVESPALTQAASASARAYLELRRMIVHHEIQPGTVINEVDTAAQLDVSRTPIREALRTLLNDGLVEEGSRRQLAVTRLSPDTAREVALMRTTLERLVSREAATNAGASDIDQLRLIMIRTRRAIEADDHNAILDEGEEFHIQLARSAHMPLVVDFLTRLCGLSRLIEAPPVPYWVHLLDAHDAIIAALDRKDPDEVEAAMDGDLQALSQQRPAIP